MIYEKKLMKLQKEINSLPSEYHKEGLLREDYEIEENGEKDALVIIYRRDLSTHTYTKKKVYDVLSTISSWGKLRRAIKACLNDDSMEYGEYALLNKRHPSFKNYLIKHHKYEEAHIDGLIDGVVMRYIIIEPYDD